MKKGGTYRRLPDGTTVPVGTHPAEPDNQPDEPAKTDEVSHGEEMAGQAAVGEDRV